MTALEAMKRTREPGGLLGLPMPYLVAVSVTLILMLAPAFNPSSGTISLLCLVVVYGIAVMSLDYVFGYGGMMSFGHAALFAFGAYMGGFVLLHLNTEILIGLPLAALATALLGAFWGILLGRLEGVAFAMGTLALASSVRFLFIQLRDITGGTDGLVALPLAEFFGMPIRTGALYYVSVLIAFAIFLILKQVVRTRYGLSLQAVRDNPQRAEAAGINVYGHRVVAMGISGAVAGVAGALFVYLQGAIDPSQAHWVLSGHFMIQLLMGGPGTLIGPFIAALFMTYLQHWLSGVIAHWELILGTLVVLFVYFTPRGVVPGIIEFAGWYRRRRRT
ncbi:branched-chain amino acid ABC transporter permease [Limibacillus sp. MBR-115]|jgi:branched-chain amino acid transport system permease protein|uniref:branched-chain amino acid ABC transporter permease n=1 Tax=Limibacillus sp. MBR-115 TaxID=3156465 RepID=UPI003399A383